MPSSDLLDRHRRDDSHSSARFSFSTIGSTLARWALFAVLPAASLTLACSGEGDVADGLDGGLGQGVEFGPCETGQVRACGKTLEQANGALTCFRGSQECDDGTWGECTDGEVVVEVDFREQPEFLEREGLAISSAAICDDNPCDPGCMAFVEDPPDIGLVPSGPVSGVPTLVTCDHGLCTEGAGLVDGCDPCVTTICAAHPGCCDGTDPNGWGPDCVAATYGMCDGSAPPVGLCDFALFSETDLSLLRDSSVIGGQVGSTTAMSLHQITTGVDLVAGGGITLDNGSYTGAIFSGSTLTTLNGATHDAGRTYENVTTTLPSIPTRSVSCLTPGATTHVTGASVLTVNPGDTSTYDINNSSGMVILSGPGDYGPILFSADGTLVFDRGGTYTFDDLNVTAGSPTLLFPPGEKVVIETCTGLSIQNGATVETHSKVVNACFTTPRWDGSLWWYSPGTRVYHNGRTYQATGGHDPHTAAYVPGTGSSWATVWTDLGACSEFSYAASGSAPGRFELEWYTNATSTVTIGPGALGAGALIAPHATVAPQAGDFLGTIYAESIQGNTDFRLDASGLTGAPCVFAGVATAVGGTCPVATVPQPLNEPCVTGRDCQINHRCVEPETGASCAHSKCAPGAALDPVCDECVERICNVDASCCTDEWDEDCVDQVASVCDATCDGYSCLHQPCDIGTPLEPSCDSCIATVCSTSGFEDCCTDKWSFKCVLEFRDVCGAPPVVTPPTAGGSVCDYSAYGRYELQAISVDLIGGWVGSPSSASQNIAFSNIVGNATSSGSLNAHGSVVTGDLLSGSGSIAAGTVLGSVLTGVPPTPVLPSKNLTGCAAGAESRSGDLAPGTYRDVTVADGQSLVLREGTYTFNSLTIGTGGAGAQLVLPSDGSIVEINVCTNVDFGLNSDMTGLSQATAMNVSVYAEGYIAAHGDNTLYGLLMSVGVVPWYPGPCPSGDPCNLAALQPASVYIGMDTTVYGIVAGERRVDARRGAVIDSTGLEDMCELIWDPGTTVTYPMCPVSLTPNLPNESATCEENVAGYEDATCSGYDLALGIPCSQEVPVCNHGTTAFSGNVEVGYWALSHQQLSTPTPSAPDGSCSDTLTIAPGSCEMLSCPSLPSGEHTMMVDPDSLLGECDDRRLDNWTLHDDRSCPSPMPRTEVQRYEAVCPDNSTARWGLLTWSTTTPGTSTVTFSGITAESAAAFGASPAYQLLGVAEAGPPNTQLCGVGGPSPLCPVDLTAELGLGENQDQFLELSIVLDGADMPVLEDWKVTYSCVVDQ